MFIDRAVNSGKKEDLSKCETIIRALKADPFKYDNLIYKMQERYIGYLLRTFKLFNIELIINYDKRLICLLIDELFRQDR